MADKFIGTMQGVGFKGERYVLSCQKEWDGKGPHTHTKPETAAQCIQRRLRANLPITSDPIRFTTCVELNISVSRLDGSGHWVRWAVEQGLVNN